MMAGDLVCRIYADRTAELILPACDATGVQSVPSAQLRRACDELMLREIRQVTTYVPVEDAETQSNAIAAGFRRTHDLLVLTCATEIEQSPGIHASQPVPAPETEDWRFRPYARGEQTAMESVFSRTLINSLDFPQLRNTVAASDVFARFSEAGATGSRWWYVVEYRGALAGCLLITDHPDRDRCELLYMGLAPEYRGRGGGQVLATYALWTALQIGRRAVIAGVDAENDPAIAVYAAAGFDPSVRRCVFFRELATAVGVSPCPGWD